MDNESANLKENNGRNDEDETSVDSKQKETTKEAVEGGWGYFVCFGTVICFIAGIGHINSFGLLYNDFIIESHSTTKSFTTAHGTFAMMLAVGGIITNILSKLKVSLRLSGLIGAITFCFGSFLTIIITNIKQLIFTFGVLQGAGFGIIVSVAYSTINHYFIRKRTTVMSLCKAIQGLILIWYPLLLRNVIIHYGFRGTLLIISGIALHMIPGAAVMRTRGKNTRNRAANKLESQKGQLERIGNLEDNEDLLGRSENDQEPRSKLKTVTRVRYILEEILCFKVLKDYSYMNICLGQSFVNYSDLAFFMLQPMLLYQYGYDSADIATCISIGAGADVAGRFTLAFISNSTSLNTKLLFYVAALLTFLMRIVMLQLRGFLWVSMATAILGVLRAWLHVASPLVISHHVSHQDFPGAYALFLLICGLVNMTLSPIIGQLKDVYEDYLPAFWALSSCCVPCLVFWPLEYVFRKKVQSIPIEE